MRQRRMRAGRVWLVGLFFVTVGLVNAQSPTLMELQAENSRLKQAVRDLTEKLAVARSETDLFQKCAEDAQLRAAAVAGKVDEPAATQFERQFSDSVRALARAQAERQKLVEQLQQLLRAVAQQRDVSNAVVQAKAVLAECVATGGGAGTLSEALVVDVNPRLQMVVLDIGRQQGARVGMPVVVVRGDRVVAELKVIEVRQQMCGALIEQAEKDVILKVGDHAQVTKS